MLVGIRDPGNAGTVLRTADAAGADAVVFAGETVDPYNGKAVRASAGSLFHLDVVRSGDPAAVITTVRDAGLTVLAADAYGEQDLDTLADDGALDGPTAWVFGSEAHGLPDGPGRGDRCPGARAAVRPGREPESRRGGGRLPLRLGAGAAPRMHA